MNNLQQHNFNIVNQSLTLTLVQNNYHFSVMINERNSFKEKIEKIQEQFHSIEKDIEIKDYSELDKKFKEIWQAISYLIDYDKLQCNDKIEEYKNYFNMIKSIYAVIDLYKTRCQNFDVNINIIHELKEIANKYSEKLDDNFWLRHKIYHYLKKRGLSQKNDSEYKEYLKYMLWNKEVNDPLNVCNLVDEYESNQYTDDELKLFFDEYSDDTLFSFFRGILSSFDMYDGEKYFSFDIYDKRAERKSPNYVSYFFDNREQVVLFAISVEIKKVNELYQSLEHHKKVINE